MNKTTLQQLFFGEIFPSENIGNDNPELQKMQSILADEKSKFADSLPDSHNEDFQNLSELQNKAEGIYSYECFAYGFKLATSLLLESLGGTNKADGGNVSS